MMTSIFKKMTVALALVGALGAASAMPVLSSPYMKDLGTLNDTLTFSRIGINGPFDDVLYFKVGALLDGSYDIGGSVIGVLNATYSFGVGDSYSKVSWFLTESLGPVEDFDFFNSEDFPVLESGKTYWLEIKGSMSQGLYSANIRPSELPEPGSMALILVGAGALVATARRRNNAANRMGA